MSSRNKSRRHINVFLTLDCFGTLYTPHPAVNVQYSDFVRSEAGVEMDPGVVGKQMVQAFKYMDKHHPNYGKEQHQQQLFPGKDTDVPYSQASAATKKQILDNVHDWWAQIIQMSFHPHALHPDVVRGLDNHFQTRRAYELYPDVIPALEMLTRLKENPEEKLLAACEAGTKTAAAATTISFNFGVISNSDPRVFSILKNLGLDVFFPDHSDVYLSYDMGISKPDPKVFGHVAATQKLLGESSDDNVQVEYHFFHVGDEVEKDQQAASRVPGWSGVLVDRSGDTFKNGLQQSSFHVIEGKLGTGENEHSRQYAVKDLRHLEQVIVNHLRLFS